MNEETNKKQKWPKRKLIKAIVTLVIIALLVVSVFIFVSKNNANAQIKRFSESIENNNANVLAEVLSTNDKQMTTEEAKNLISYLKSDENPNRLDDTLKKVKKNLKSGNSISELGTLKDKNGEPVISFSKNGKKLFVLDKISIEPHYREVYIRELDNTATYEFDNKHRVAVDKNKVSKLGEFVVGDYDVPVKKVFRDSSVNGKINGKIHVNTDDIQKGNHIVAKQDFNQTKIKIKLHNDDKLSDKNRKVIINGNTKPLKKDKVYGYFPNSNSFSVEAKGEMKGHRFKTNKVEVLQGTTNNSTQVVNLYFDEKQISKEIKKEEKMKNKLSKFIKAYIDDLSKAYKNKDYNEVSKYIKSNSDAEKFMEPKFKDKQSVKYKNIDVEKVEKEGNSFKITVKKRHKSIDMNNIYHVKIENDEPKIFKIENI